MGPIPFIPYTNDFMVNDPNFIENRNESYRTSYMLFTPTLEDLKNALYVALNPFFEEFEIEVVSCPCLTKAPYNLAAAGLSGNTGILQIGDFRNFYPRPQTAFVYNIQDMFSRYNDVFVIGSGFATQPFMPYNGYLTMNAVVSTNHRNINNNSCIAYKEVPSGERKLEIINDHSQIRCCLFGHFFFSEGKRGPVIKMRAKGRRYNDNNNIYALIQIALRKCCVHQPVGIGIVFVINGGITNQLIIREDFVRLGYNKYKDYFERLRTYKSNCKNLIALGPLMTKHLKAYDLPDGRRFLRDETSMFNTFYNPESAGEFFNDATPEETEYIVYFNVAQERCLLM